MKEKDISPQGEKENKMNYLFSLDLKPNSKSEENLFTSNFQKEASIDNQSILNKKIKVLHKKIKISEFGKVKDLFDPLEKRNKFIEKLNKYSSLPYYINNYQDIKIIKPNIGKGGSAKVSLGLWHGTNVAIKELSMSENDGKAVEKFAQEINILSKLQHPNILLYIGSAVDLDKKKYYLITEYLQQGSLFDYLHKNNKKLNDRQKISIAFQIASGLKYIHSRGIVHCDLKSSNILLDEHFKIKLSDFGLSQYKSELCKPLTLTFVQSNSTISISSSINNNNNDNNSSPPFEQETRVLGTSRWMAPEVLLKKKTHSFSSDIYSYGMVIKELLTGKIPYDEDKEVTNLEVKDILTEEYKKYINSKCQEKNEERTCTTNIGNKNWDKPEEKKRNEDLKKKYGKSFKENMILVYIAEGCLNYDPDKRFSLDSILNILNQVNEFYERNDEVIEDIYNFIL